MINFSIHDNSFDPVAYETEREQVFERSLAQQQFSENPKDFPTDNFPSGEWDGLQGFEPEPHQWASADYRAGYHSGINKRFNKLIAA